MIRNLTSLIFRSFLALLLALSTIVVALAQQVVFVGPTNACEGESIQLTAVPQFGTPQYNFVWSDGTIGISIVVSVAGNYTVTVTDALGVTATGVATVSFSDINITADVYDALCAGDNTGSIDLTVTGSNAPFTLQWSNGQSTPDLVGLPAGTYTATVTDALSCSETETFIVSSPPPISITGIVTPSSCNAATGSITWEVLNGPTPPPMTNLVPGTYTVTVTNNEGCSNTAIATVESEVDINVTGAIINVSCFGANNGSIDVTATGSNMPYVYLWNNGATTQDLTGLAAGTYFLTVYDANLCQESRSFTVSAPTALNLTGIVTDISCTVSSGSIDLTVTGGVWPYTYDWSHIAGTNNPADLFNLSAGAYGVTVTDANGCSRSEVFIVSNLATFNLTGVVTPSSCSVPTGSIDLTVTGGATPFSYNWSDINTGIEPQDRSNLSAGSYTVTVTDNTACSVVRTFVVTNQTNLNVTGNVTPASCDANNGSINLTVTGGASPYVFVWSHIAGQPDPEDVTGLPVGTYTVTVFDAVGCSVTRTFLVTSPPQLFINLAVTNPTCGVNNGSIQSFVSGGTPPYIYLWSNGATTQNLSNLSVGTYTVTITDANGCTAIDFGVVTQPGFPIITVGINLLCNNDNATIQATTFAGTPPYTYQWSNGSTISTITNVPAGVYSVTVTDANGCSRITTYSVIAPPPLIANIITCDGSANVSVSGGTPPYQYVWSGPNIANIFIQNPMLPIGGPYTVIVTDALGCTATDEIIVLPNPDPCTKITGTVVRDLNDNCSVEISDQPLLNILVQAQIVGSQQTFYAWTNGAGEYEISVLPNLNYVVEVVDPPFNGQVCAPTQVAVNSGAPGTVSTGDFVIEDIPGCHDIQVTMSSSLMRRCSTTIFYVHYRNLGSLDAEDVFIDVVIDDDLNITSAQISYADLGNNVYRFFIGDLSIGQSGLFWYRALIPCSAMVGQTYCTDVFVTPDNSCDSITYEGALLSVRSVCNADSLEFIVKNVGQSAMTTSSYYVVIEDGIMTMMQPINPLNTGDSIVVSLPANGSTWRIEADQVDEYPGELRPELSVEGCTTTGQFSTGYVLQFPNNAQLPVEYTYCNEIVAAFDPNDKLGLPLGYGPNRYIDAGTRIDYRIRFQNTGNDTAFAVVIRDTLSQWFDLTSIRPGASSHNYTFELEGNTLVFDFPNIMLPDSNVNVETSQGFVNFSIRVADTIPLGTDINNSAAIYFDINPPVITNATTHRVDKDFIQVGLWEPVRPIYKISVQPNPTAGHTLIGIMDVEIPDHALYQLSVQDALGRVVTTVQNTAPQFTMETTSWASGPYWFQITRDRELMGSGQLIVR
jgi:uncharacterized repeat protein (TIGR01451 family)